MKSRNYNTFIKNQELKRIEESGKRKEIPKKCNSPGCSTVDDIICEREVLTYKI